MRIAIVGSRDYPRPELVARYVRGLPGGTVVVTGDCPEGPDRTAAEAAQACELELVVHVARWETYGDAAGPIRNGHVVGDCDRLVAFVDPLSRGGSKGTFGTIKLARRRGVPVECYGPDGDRFVVPGEAGDDERGAPREREAAARLDANVQTMLPFASGAGRR
jgi:hypothetical protein